MMAATMIAAPEAVDGARAGSHANLTAGILPSLAAAEGLWRDFERQADGSPYQRFDWVAAFATSAGLAADMRVAVLRSQCGDVVALLPLVLTRRFGLRIATAPGGKHANYNRPLLAAGYAQAQGAIDWPGALRDIGRLLCVDVLTIGNVPRRWNGQAGPLAELGRPGANQAFRLDLEPDGDATLGRSMSADARKKLRAKERGLAKLGEIAFLEARDPAEAGRILEVFFAQKSRRFRERGITDPFSEAWAQDFLRKAAEAGLAGGRPALELYALAIDDRIVATLGGAADERRLSGMFISFDVDAEAARFSPGDVLVTRVVRAQCARGRRTFDLGVGDARYKRSICDGVDALVDVTVAVTRRGAAFAALQRLVGDARRRAKADPRVLALVSRLRSARAQLSR